MPLDNAKHKSLIGNYSKTATLASLMSLGCI